MSLEFNSSITTVKKEWIITDNNNNRAELDPNIIIENLLLQVKESQRKASGLRDIDMLDELEKHIGICRKHLENNDTGKAAITFFWLGRIAHELEAIDTKDKLESWSRKASNNGKKGNPTPTNTIEYFYECAEKIIKFDKDNQLYLKDVAELAREELLDKVADYELQWKNDEPFELKWFHNKLKQHPNLPDYLQSRKGKRKALREDTLNEVKNHFGF